MWTITSVTVDTNSRGYVIFGGAQGKEMVGPTGPFSANYVVCFPGLGYMTLQDKGNTGA